MRRYQKHDDNAKSNRHHAKLCSHHAYYRLSLSLSWWYFPATAMPPRKAATTGRRSDGSWTDPLLYIEGSEFIFWSFIYLQNIWSILYLAPVLGLLGVQRISHIVHTIELFVCNLALKPKKNPLRVNFEPSMKRSWRDHVISGIWGLSKLTNLIYLTHLKCLHKLHPLRCIPWLSTVENWNAIAIGGGDCSSVTNWQVAGWTAKGLVGWLGAVDLTAYRAIGLEILSRTTNG